MRMGVGTGMGRRGREKGRVKGRGGREGVKNWM